MEREPKQPKRYYVELGGEKILLGPENTLLFLHGNQPIADHFYIQLEDDENGEQRGHYEWREAYVRRNEEDRFNEMLLNLVQIGCDQILKADPSPFDCDQFKARFGYYPHENDTNTQVADKDEPQSPINAPEIELKWVSPRNERLIEKTAAYIVYLAERGLL